MNSAILRPFASSDVRRPSFRLRDGRWLLATALLLAGTQSWAQSGTITIQGVIVDGVTANHNEQGVAPAGYQTPRVTSTQALNDIAAPRGEILDYFAERSNEAGISTDRLRLVKVDYL